MIDFVQTPLTMSFIVRMVGSTYESWILLSVHVKKTKQFENSTQQIH